MSTTETNSDARPPCDKAGLMLSHVFYTQHGSTTMWAHTELQEHMLYTGTCIYKWHGMHKAKLNWTILWDSGMMYNVWIVNITSDAVAAHRKHSCNPSLTWAVCIWCLTYPKSKWKVLLRYALQWASLFHSSRLATITKVLGSANIVDIHQHTSIRCC